MRGQAASEIAEVPSLLSGTELAALCRRVLSTHSFLFAWGWGGDAAVPGARPVSAFHGLRDLVFLIDECYFADANSTEFDPKTAHPVVSLWQLLVIPFLCLSSLQIRAWSITSCGFCLPPFTNLK